MLAHMNNSEDQFFPASLRIGYRGTPQDIDQMEQSSRGRSLLMKGINSDYADFIANQMHYDARSVRDMIITMKMLIEDLERERDEARRIACENEARHNSMMFDNQNYSDPVAIAEKRGWDCFDRKENNDGSK